MCHCEGRNRCALDKDSYSEVRNEFPVIWLPLPHAMVGSCPGMVGAPLWPRAGDRSLYAFWGAAEGPVRSSCHIP